MKLTAPGSTGWLIRHELRITWRYWIAMTGGRMRGMYIGFGLIIVVALVVGLPVGFLTRAVDSTPLPGAAIAGIDLAIAFLLTLMLASTISTATLTFHDRGDLDLLLASPLPPTRILTVRKLVMAFNALITFFIILAPFVIASAVLGGHWGWLTSLPMLVALGLFATSLGVAGAFGLFRILGPRRTRTFAQIFGAMIGASVFIASQSHLIFGGDDTRSFWRGMASDLRQWDVPLWAQWPAGAATGAPIPFLVIVGGLTALFFLSSRALGARFAANAAIAAGAQEQTLRKSTRTTARPFAGGAMRVMVRKELRLLARDPGLLSQVLLQVIYLIPVSFIILRQASDDSAEGLITKWSLASGAGLVCFLCGQIAAGLGWLTMSAEEAPELLTAAPVAPQRVGRAKVLAVMIPIAVLLTIPAVLVARFAPWVSLCIVVGGLSTAASIAYIELWTQKPGKKSEFRMRRKGTGNIWVALLELLLCGLFGLTTTLTAAGTWFGLIPAAILVAVITLFKKDRWLNRNG